MTLYVGTSGWAYKEWKPAFYPPDVPQSRFLDHYSRTLTACEINATFYRLQSESTFSRWVGAAPPSFRFATKAHRALTHSRKLEITDDRLRFLNRFLSSLEAFGDRLGVVLFQFPPSRRCDAHALENLLAALPKRLVYAFEFRNESWSSDEVQDIVGGAGTVAVSDTTGDVPEKLPPGPIAYVRLRAERYEAGRRAEWARLLHAEAEERDVYAFAKHEGIPAGDRLGGVGLAQWLVAETERAMDAQDRELSR